MSTAATPPWAQPGVTDVPVARAFLETLRARDTLVLTSNDGEPGHPPVRRGSLVRGHGVTIASNLVAASRPPDDVAALHATFGFGALHVYCPHVVAPDRTLAELALADEGLIAALRTDRLLRRILVSYRCASTSRLIERLGLAPAFCDPSPAAYERANDKLELARAGPRHGFATLPAEPVADDTALAACFPSLAATYGAGCIVRARRGSAGRDIHRARTARTARWRRGRLAKAGHAALVLPYVPPSRVRRNVAAHGIVTADGFAPFLFTDQIIHRRRFRGGMAVTPWSPDDVAAVRAGLDGVAGWYREIGYVGAPAGVDGFLMDEADGPRFLVLDSNARFSATVGPWAAATVLAERAGRPLPWCFELFRLIGRPVTVARIRARLGEDLLDPDRIARGGVLPTFVTHEPRGPLTATNLWAIIVGRDAADVDRLRRRVRRLVVIAR